MRSCALLEAGQRDFGENRVQEAAAKWPALRERFPDVRLHLIGQLQSNKADEAVQLFDAIHSVDRPSLVEALGRAIGRTAAGARLLRPGQSGRRAAEGRLCGRRAAGFAASRREAGLPIAGLMCIPPADLEPAPWFALLAELARRHDVKGLSMGMSGDYETAVMIGATHVRVGTALFGAARRSPARVGGRCGRAWSAR